MTKISSEEASSIFKRTAEYKPPRSWRTALIGRPLATADAPHQTIGKLVGLAVFASDALSSTAYATQEILFILAAAGTAAFGDVPRIIARINNPRNAWLFDEKFHVDVPLNQAEIMSSLIEEEMSLGARQLAALFSLDHENGV